MTEREKSRKEIEEEVAIILKAVDATRNVLDKSFMKMWELMHSEPYLSRKQLLNKTEDGRKAKSDITAYTVSGIESAIKAYAAEACGLLIEDYDISDVDDDFDGYVRRYSEKFSDFAEAFIIAYILSGIKDKHAAWIHLLIYKDNPMVAPVFKNNSINPSIMSQILAPLTGGLGKGNYISPFADFDRLTKYTIHKNFSEAKIAEMASRGYEWYRCFRNSNYDCPACDDVCSVPHRITEIVLPVHPNCVCGMYPINEDEL